MRLHMAEMLQADMLEDEQALEYLVDYGVKRAGMRTEEELNIWMRDMLRQAGKHLKGRTSGSAAKDMAIFLQFMDDVGGRSPG